MGAFGRRTDQAGPRRWARRLPLAAALAATTCLIFLGATTAIGAPSVAIDADAIELSGTVVAEGTFTGDLVATASEDVVAWVVPSDLTQIGTDPAADVPGEGPATCHGPTGCIDRSQVTVTPPNATLSAGVRTAFRISVTGITEPGLYTGQVVLQFRAAPQPAQSPSPAPSLSPLDTITVPMAIRAFESTALPTLPKQEGVVARRTLLVGPVDDFFGPLVLPNVEQQPIVAVPFVNPGSDTLHVAGMTVVALGQNTGHLLTSPLASVETPGLPDGSVPATLRTPFAVSLDLPNIERDRYVGAVYVTVAGVNQPFAVPFDVTVRGGPTGPLVLISLGIAFGIVARFVAEKGTAATDAEDSLKALVTRLANADILAADRAALRPMVEAATADFTAGRIAATSDKVKAINGALDVLISILGFERRYPGVEPEKLASARAFAYSLDVPNAQAQFAEAHKAVKDPPRTLGPGGDGVPGTPTRRPRLLLVGATLVVLVAAVALVTILPSYGGPGVAPSPGPSGAPIGPPLAVRETGDDQRLVTFGVIGLGLALFLSLMPWLSGRRFVRWTAWIRIARVAINIVTPVALAVLGLRILYGDNAAALIASQIDPLYQFLLWGFAAGLGTKTLSSLVK